MVTRFTAIEDCDGGLAGEGEFEFDVFVVFVQQGFEASSRLLRRSADLSDGESYAVHVTEYYQIPTNAKLTIMISVTESDVFSADSRMDGRLGTISVLPDETGPFTIVVGESGCKVRLEISVD